MVDSLVEHHVGDLGGNQSVKLVVLHKGIGKAWRSVQLLVVVYHTHRC